METKQVTGYIQQLIEGISRQNKETIRIFLPPGVYRERVEIRVPNLILEGECPDNTIIVTDYHASEILSNGERRGTFRSYTMFIGADHVTLRNLTVRNDAAPREHTGQLPDRMRRRKYPSHLSASADEGQGDLFPAPEGKKNKLTGKVLSRLFLKGNGSTCF